MRTFPARQCLAVLVLILCVTACTKSIPRGALQLSRESLQHRQMQSRHFDTKDEAAILNASAALLQDLGFNLDESETDLGVLVASKRRDATEVGQVVGTILLMFVGKNKPYDKEQQIRASLVTRPYGDRITVRITFQRKVWNNKGKLTKVEGVNDRKIYQHFFDKLSKSVFLEAHMT
jgi:hypothetical protein